MVTPKRGLGDVAVQEFDNYCSLVEEYYDANFPGTTTPTPFDILISLSGGSSQTVEPGAPLQTEALSKRTLNLLKDFAWQMCSIRDRAHQEPLENVLAAIIRELKLISHLDKISKSVSEFEERKRNVNELQQAALSYTNQGPCLATVETADDAGEDGISSSRETPLGNFLDDVALVTDLAERSSEERFVVNLMTAHASKGMEFDTVFVLGNEDGTFPTSQVHTRLLLHKFR